MKQYIVRHIKHKYKDKYTHEYFDQDGRKVNNNIIKQCVNHIYIPPAYEDVQINLNKHDKILAIGYDTKDRPQYIYNKQFVQSQSKKKYKKLIDFGESYKQIIEKIHRDLKLDNSEKNKQIALVLKLVIDCNFRIGNERYSKENKSFGVTTLQQRHIKVSNDTISIDFIGKKGVQNKCKIKHKELSKHLRKKKRTLQKNDNIFEYVSGDYLQQIKSSDVNQYLKQFGDFSTKNFRTWNANIELITELLQHKIPSDKKNRDKLLSQIIKTVSFKLHHTPSICKKNYIDPYILDIYTNDPKRFFHTFKHSKTKDKLIDNYIDLLYSEYG